jgi:hypothetical protein
MVAVPARRLAQQIIPHLLEFGTEAAPEQCRIRIQEDTEHASL